MKRLVVAVAALSTLAAISGSSGSALAADLALKSPRPMAAPAPAYSWTGCYVDGGAGFGMWNQTNFSESSPGVRLTADQTTGGQGWFGQIGGGCDYQFPVAGWGSFVVGVLADYSFMNLHGQFDDDASGDNGREKESGAWAVGARVGYIVTPNLLTYFNGGWTQTRFDQINLTAFESSASSGAFVPATTYSGWFLGGGTETSLAGFFGLPLPPGLFLRSEYRYSSFSAKDVSFGGTALSGETSVNMKKNVQTISTALVWKFNWGGY